MHANTYTFALELVWLCARFQAHLRFVLAYVCIYVCACVCV